MELLSLFWSLTHRDLSPWIAGTRGSPGVGPVTAMSVLAAGASVTLHVPGMPFSKSTTSTAGVLVVVAPGGTGGTPMATKEDVGKGRAGLGRALAGRPGSPSSTLRIASSNGKKARSSMSTFMFQVPSEALRRKMILSTPLPQEMSPPAPISTPPSGVVTVPSLARSRIVSALTKPPSSSSWRTMSSVDPLAHRSELIVAFTLTLMSEPPRRR